MRVDGPRGTAAAERPANHLLACLPAELRKDMLADLQRVTMKVRDPVWEANETIEHIHFPESGVFSLVAVMENGLAAEVATVGNEGMLGLPIFLGATQTPLRAFVQVGGESLRMPVAAFSAQVHEDPGGPLPILLHRYTQVMFVQVGQSAACNRLHTILQRCARWLLMTHDRVGHDQFEITQEFLAQMIGVRRASANRAAKTLQDEELLRYARGRITILDRPGLERAACECYGIIRAEYDRMLG